MADAIARETDGAFRINVFPESRLGPDPQCSPTCAAARSNSLSPAPLWRPGAHQRAAVAALRIRGTCGGVRRARRRARRPDSRRAGAPRSPRLSPLPAERISSSDDQRPANSTAADLASVKIRSPGGEIARDFFATFGAEAGYAPFNRMYGALKRRHFDGQSDPLGVVLSLKPRGAEPSELDASLVVGFHPARQCRSLGPFYRRKTVRSSRLMPRNSFVQRQDAEAIDAAGAEEGPAGHDRQHRRPREL